MKENYHIQSKSLFHYLILLVIFGTLTGLLLSYYIETNDVAGLSTYFQQLPKDIPTNLFQTTCFQLLLFQTCLFFIGTSCIGSIFLSFFTFTKGLQFGFSCMLFLHTYSYKGILGIFLQCLPNFLIDIIPFLMMSHLALRLSIHLLQCSMTNRKIIWNMYLQPILNTFIIVLLSIFITSYLKITLLHSLSLLFQRLIS